MRAHRRCASAVEREGGESGYYACRAGGASTGPCPWGPAAGVHQLPASRRRPLDLSSLSERARLDTGSIVILSAAALLLLPVALALVLPATVVAGSLAPFFGKFFDLSQVSAYVLFVVFFSSILIAIRRARSGADLYIRPIA